LQKKSRP